MKRWIRPSKPSERFLPNGSTPLYCAVELDRPRIVRLLAIGVNQYINHAGEDVFGKTPLYAAIDGRLASLIGVADPIKETTPLAITALHNAGLKVAMITGDNSETARAIADDLGIDEVVSEVLPDGKVELQTSLD